MWWREWTANSKTASSWCVVFSQLLRLRIIWSFGAWSGGFRGLRIVVSRIDVWMAGLRLRLLDQTYRGWIIWRFSSRILTGTDLEVFSDIHFSAKIKLLKLLTFDYPKNIRSNWVHAHWRTYPCRDTKHYRCDSRIGYLDCQTGWARQKTLWKI